MSARQLKRQRERGARRQARRMDQRARRAAAAAGAALGATVLFAPAADAATFPVTKLADTNDNVCDADCSLREAAYEANQAAGDDVITFASSVTGTIELSASLGHIALFYDGVQIQGPGAGLLTVSGEDDDRIFKLFGFDAPNEQVVISGLTLANGSSGSGIFGGGAIHNSEGLGIEPYAADLAIADSVLTENETSSTGDAREDGGAIKSLYGDVTITNSTISGNYAYYQGGGVLVDEGALAITDSTITGNDADKQGGGVYSDDGSLTIERSTFSGNVAYDGGAINLETSAGGAGLTIDASTISGNPAAHYAGGILVDSPKGPVEIRNTTVSGNSAGEGVGGIAIYNFYDAPVTITNSTIVGNSQSTAPQFANFGAGISRYGLDDPDYAGDDAVTLSSTVVANNTGGAGDLGEPGAEHDGSFAVGFSLVENTGNATITESPAGSNLLGVDPLLGPLADNGGPTQTMLPALGSPALDAGIANGLTTDQRGLARTFDASNLANAAGGDGTDIGSAELAAEGTCKGKAATVLFAAGQKITGSSAKDVVVGTDKKDKINTKGGKDTVCAGKGNDKVKGGGGKDTLLGQRGKDTLKGGGGKDKLKGGPGNDKLRGGPGKDKLSGGGGKDLEVQ